MARNQQMSFEQLQVYNAQMRRMLVASSPEIQQPLTTITAQPGQVTRVKLNNVGITTELHLDVQCGVAIGVATATPSPRAPYNLINRIIVTDTDQTQRVVLSGFQLYVLNCVRERNVYGLNNGAVAAAFVNPQVPTAVGNGTIAFQISVPLAFDAYNADPDKRDFRGALLMQVATGEAYLTIEWNPTLYANGSADAVYNGAATTTVGNNPATNNITCTVYQRGVFPQPLANGQPALPTIDLNTVYELNQFVTSDNIQVGAEKLITVPSAREVVGIYANYIQGGLQANGAINRFRYIVNSNNPLIEDSERTQLFYQRRWMVQDADIAAGAYFREFRARAVATALLGNVQWGLTPATVGANPRLEVLVESFYTKGSALPGITIS